MSRHHIDFTLDRTRPETVRINATPVGERLEIEIFDDDHVGIPRFFGNEEIVGGMSLQEQLLADDAAGSEA